MATREMSVRDPSWRFQASVFNGDIFEAFQCIQCVIQHDLSFRDPSPAVEAEIDAEDSRGNDDYL